VLFATPMSVDALAFARATRGTAIGPATRTSTRTGPSSALTLESRARRPPFARRVLRAATQPLRHPQLSAGVHRLVSARTHTLHSPLSRRRRQFAAFESASAGRESYSDTTAPGRRPPTHLFSGGSTFPRCRAPATGPLYSCLRWQPPAFAASSHRPMKCGPEAAAWPQWRSEQELSRAGVVQCGLSSTSTWRSPQDRGGASLTAESVMVFILPPGGSTFHYSRGNLHGASYDRFRPVHVVPPAVRTGVGRVVITGYARVLHESAAPPLRV